MPAEVKILEVELCDSPGEWVSLDESDNDLRTFLSCVLAAIRLLFLKIWLKTDKAPHDPHAGSSHPSPAGPWIRASGVGGDQGRDSK